MKLIKRKRGQKLPEGTVYIGRPTKWGNPYKVGKNRTAKEAVNLYIDYLEKPIHKDFPDTKKYHLLGLYELEGKDLACWCGEWEFGEPEIDCHGVVLMKMANSLFRNARLPHVYGAEKGDVFTGGVAR